VIRVQVETGGRAVVGDRLAAAVRRALQAREVRAAEVSLTLLDDDAMRELHREHLGHDHTTDVLAFALWEPGEPLVVGDVYVGFDQARRQAATEGVALDEELLRLAVHGTLHVTGMEHPDQADARADSAMYRLQESLVAALRSEESP
jgi:probable rRNA maturation factor